jgi:SAM-dependent methyltransferase
VSCGAPAAPVPERVAWAVEQLDAATAARVLEVGCGAGHAVGLICARSPGAVVTAIDRSALQVARARARNGALVAAGRVRVEQVALSEAPALLGLRTFDAALAVNVNAFWTAPAPSLGSLTALLAPGGRAVLVYEPPTAATLRVLRGRVASALGGRGFAVEAMRETAFRAGRGLCIVARAQL